MRNFNLVQILFTQSFGLDIMFYTSFLPFSLRSDIIQQSNIVAFPKVQLFISNLIGADSIFPFIFHSDKYIFLPLGIP